MNKKLIFFILFIFLASPINPAFAKGFYVRDWISVPLRSGPDTKTSTVTTVNTDDYLEVVYEKGEWILVKTQKGQEGWILNRYLTEAPRSFATSQLRQKVASQDKTANELREDNKRLGKENQTLKFETSKLNSKLNKLTQDYESLKKASSSYLTLKSEHEQLLEKRKVEEEEVKKILKENKKFKTTERVAFTLFGGGLVLIGLLIGYFSQSSRYKPKRSGYRF
jgi:SH3 domain protein